MYSGSTAFQLDMCVIQEALIRCWRNRSSSEIQNVWTPHHVPKTLDHRFESEQRLTWSWTPMTVQYTARYHCPNPPVDFTISTALSRGQDPDIHHFALQPWSGQSTIFRRSTIPQTLKCLRQGYAWNELVFTKSNHIYKQIYSYLLILSSRIRCDESYKYGQCHTLLDIPYIKYWSSCLKNERQEKFNPFLLLSLLYF